MNEIFRFMVLRPPQAPDPSISKPIRIESDQSDYQNQVKKGRSENDGARRVQEATERFLASPDYVKDLRSPGLPLLEFADRFATERPNGLPAVSALVQSAFGRSAKDVVSDATFSRAFTSIGDSVMALILAGRENEDHYDHLVGALRLCALIERAANQDASLNRPRAIERALNETVVLPRGILPAPTLSNGEATPSDIPEPTATTRSELARTRDAEEQIQNLRLAFDEISALEVLSTESSSSHTSTEPARTGDGEPVESDDQSRLASARPAPRLLSASGLARLSSTAINEIGALGLDPGATPIPDIKMRLVERFHALAATADAPQRGVEFVPIGSKLVARATLFADSRGRSSSVVRASPLGGVISSVLVAEFLRWKYQTFRAVGFADLELVRQEIACYLPGEIAHIENVLQGESKERTHRRTRRTEEEFLTERETTEETERDLQSTDRFELEDEAEKTQKEESKFEAGVTVKYGGFVDVEASTKYATTEASEQSARTAARYAREITDRAVSKIQERVREQRVRRTIEEIEERNLHSINNTLRDYHVVGIYRWVDKLYKAQIVNYGKRMMYEFIVPEPAAFLLYAKAEQPALRISEPKEPTFGPGFLTDERGGTTLTSDRVTTTELLRPEHIQRSNYQQWIARYQVTDAEPPPPEYVHKAYNFESPNRPQKNDTEYPATQDSKTDIITLPNGYAVTWAYMVITADSIKYEQILMVKPNEPVTAKLDAYTKVSVSLGTSVLRRRINRSDSLLASDKKQKISLWAIDYAFAYQPYQFGLVSEQYTGELPVTIVARHYGKLNVGIHIRCGLTARKYQEWQQKTYASIMTAYLNRKSEYEERLAAASVQAGIEISGRNPALNRQVERAELKRGALSLLTRRWGHLQGDGAISQDSEEEFPKDLPEIDFDKWRKQAPVIQFLEHAFEWEHMVYTFYPYFWARKERWSLLQQLDDTDAQHAAFLRAGAARVLVPVRLGYEGSVWWYAQLGEPWNGKGPPTVGEDAFIPFVEEEKARLSFDFDVGPGLIRVTAGSAIATGVADGDGATPSFSEDDEDRELLIDGKRYRIRKVDEPNQVVTLAEAYRAKPPEAATSPPGESDGGGNGPANGTREVGYWISQYKLVGEPWEVKIPTSLVYLEQDSVKLPCFE